MSTHIVLQFMICLFFFSCSFYSSPYIMLCCNVYKRAKIKLEKCSHLNLWSVFICSCNSNVHYVDSNWKWKFIVWTIHMNTMEHHLMWQIKIHKNAAWILIKSKIQKDTNRAIPTYIFLWNIRKLLSPIKYKD